MFPCLTLLNSTGLKMSMRSEKSFWMLLSRWVSMGALRMVTTARSGMQRQSEVKGKIRAEKQGMQGLSGNKGRRLRDKEHKDCQGIPRQMGYEDSLGAQKQSVEHGNGQRMWGQTGNVGTATGHRHGAHGDHQGILGLPGDIGTEGKMETAGEVGNKQGIFGLFGDAGPAREGGWISR